MTWYDQVEQKRKLLVGGTLIICLAALAVTARRNPLAFDSYWHLQTGLDWLNNGLSPWIDHYSFTFAGEAIRSQPFLFQASLAWLVNQFGLEPGYQIYKLTGFVSAFGLFALFLRRLGSPVVICCVVLPLFVLLLELRSTARPELIGYSFSIIAAMLYHRARGEITMRSVLPMALLMLLWTNYHSSILGYILFFGFFVDAAVLQIKNRAAIQTWAAWLISGLLVLAVGFLNESFSHPVINALRFDPEWKDFIQEWQPATMYKGVKAIYALIIVVITTLILAAWKRRFGYLIVTMILTYFAVQMVRLVTPCGIIILCIFVSLASEFDLQKYIADSRRFVRSATGFAVLLLALTSFYSSVMNPRFFMKENKTSALIRPELIVQYMKDNQLSGHIFNELGIGGYLIHALSPDSKVYIDGRTNILYPIDHYRRFLEARNSPIELREEIERYDINLALLETDQRAYSVMFESGLLGLDYVDYKFSFFARDNPSLPFAGRLFGNPACWREEHNSQLEEEFGYALLNLPANSSALPNLGMMLGYFLAPDREEFLRRFGSFPSPTELQLRFAGYQSLLLGLYEESVNFFEAIEVWDQREFLAVALAYSRLGLWDKAEETSDHLTMILWPHVTAQDMLLLYRILETIRREQGLQRVQESYVDELRGQLEDIGRSTAELDLDPSLLCTEPTVSDPSASGASHGQPVSRSRQGRPQLIRGIG